MNANAPQTQRPASRASTALLLALLAAAPLPSVATQTVRPYEVTTRSADTTAAFTEALQTALVRVTGDRAAASAPGLQSLLESPRRFVLLYRPAAEGGLRVSLDGRALDRAIVAAGAKLWPRERDVLLVGSEAPPADADAAAWRAALEAVAEERALPLRIATAPLAADLPADAALARARAESADLVLVARAPTASPLPSWRLVSRAGEETLDGDAATVLHAVADRLARAAIDFMAQPESPVFVEVGGVGSLTDYATAQRLLAAVPGVRSVAVRELRARHVRFGVLVRGGATGLVDALAAHPRFAPSSDAAGDALAYELRPAQAP
jgi:hypothetical protein